MTDVTAPKVCKVCGRKNRRYEKFGFTTCPTWGMVKMVYYLSRIFAMPSSIVPHESFIKCVKTKE